MKDLEEYVDYYNNKRIKVKWKEPGAIPGSNKYKLIIKRLTFRGHFNTELVLKLVNILTRTTF